MATTDILYRLRIRNEDDDADLLVITSDPDGTHPYIVEPPEGDGQTLDPLSGKTAIGVYSVLVADESDTLTIPGSVAGDSFEDYADDAALLAAWTVTDAGGLMTFELSGAEVWDGVQAFRIIVPVAAGAAADGYASRTFGTADGLEASHNYTVRVRCWLNFDAGDDSQWCGLRVDGILDFVPAPGGDGYIRDWTTLEVAATSDGSGNLTVELGHFSHTLNTPVDRIAYFDQLEIVDADAFSGTGRVVTSHLADATGRPHLLSRRAAVESSTDDGSTWDNIVHGYVTAIRLIDAITYEITVGDSQRVAQTQRVFDEVDATFDRASCIIGGPIVDDFAGVVDQGRPLFTVTEVDGEFVRLRWVSGNMYAPFREFERPLAEEHRDALNDMARRYSDAVVTVEDGDVVARVTFPGLTARLYDDDTGAALDQHQFTPVGAETTTTPVLRAQWRLIADDDTIRLRWPTTGTEVPAQPSVGDEYRVTVFPPRISRDNPLHWSGHPMDFVRDVFAAIDQTDLYDETSRTTVKAALGDALTFDLRITEGSSAQEALERYVYGPFGVGTRQNSSGAIEFFLSRARSSTAPTTTVTEDALQDDGSEDGGQPVIWSHEETDAVSRIEFRSQQFFEEREAIDALGTRDVITEAVPDGPTAFGGQTLTYDIPGVIRWEGGAVFAPLAGATGEGDPGAFTLEDYVAALAREVFAWAALGPVVSNLAVLRGNVTEQIGEEIILDIAHLPTANPSDNPVMQRGSASRVVQILRRTETPAGPLLYVQDRGIATQVAETPTFTLAASSTDPRHVVTATLTNVADLQAVGARVRVEFAISADEPTGGGALARLFFPSVDTTVFDLPAVGAGSDVWVRMRAEVDGQVPGTYSAWAELDLTDLTAPSGLAASVSGTTVSLTWTNGESDVPLELRWKASGIDTYTVLPLLPAGTTEYDLVLPDASTGYTIDIRHREFPPLSGVSASDTTTATTGAATQLDAPINPSAFSDGRGRYGIEVTATEFPSAVAVSVAVETSAGSNTAGTYSVVGATVSVEGAPTRFTVPELAPNDGLKRFLKAAHTRSGFTDSDVTAEVSVLPWTAQAAAPAPPALVPSFDSSGNLTVRYTGDARTVSVRIAASTAGEPTDATVRAATAINGRTGVSGTLLTATEGDTATVKAFAYSGRDGGGSESVAAVVTAAYAAPGLDDLQDEVDALELAVQDAIVVFGLGDGTSIDADDQDWVKVPDGEIVAVGFVGDQVGTIQLDFWLGTEASLPPTDSDSITAADPFAISVSAVEGHKTSFTGWTTTITGGDKWLYVNVDSAADFTEGRAYVVIRR